MGERTPRTRARRIAVVCALVFSGAVERSVSAPQSATAPPQSRPTQVTVPSRPSRSAYQGRQGEQWSSEISFDRQSRTVTIRLSVQDVNGYFIPNLRRDNFAVYEDGIRQRNVTVEIEHAPVTLGVLVEGGSRYQQLNRFLDTEIPFAVRPLLDVLGREDKVAMFSYTDRVMTLVDFHAPLAELDPSLDRLKDSTFSEANFYDGLIDVLNRLHGIAGRHALLLITTGIDTFSKATFDEVVNAVERAKTPVYCIGLGQLARALLDEPGPLARIDWKRTDHELETLARVSGGRAYVRDPKVDLTAIYDDIMEHLRIRYVITYVSSSSRSDDSPRTVRVELVDPRTGGALRIADTAGRVVTARVIAQDSYAP